MPTLVRRYRAYWTRAEFRRSVLFSSILLILGLTANTLGGLYAAEKASNSVTDILLSNIPVFDIDIAFVYGTMLFIAFVFLLCLADPKRLPFTFKSLAIFFFIRAAFVSLTHLGPFPTHAVLDFQSKFILVLWGGGDEFFSGHTGAPFLLALIFWHDKRLRNFFLGSTLFFATIVLLGHLHYSIDVASAFFITYSIYQLAAWLFPRDKALLESAEV